MSRGISRRHVSTKGSPCGHRHDGRVTLSGDKVSHPAAPVVNKACPMCCDWPTRTSARATLFLAQGFDGRGKIEPVLRHRDVVRDLFEPRHDGLTHRFFSHCKRRKNTVDDTEIGHRRVGCNVSQCRGTDRGSANEQAGVTIEKTSPVSLPSGSSRPARPVYRPRLRSRPYARLCKHRAMP